MLGRFGLCLGVAVYLFSAANFVSAEGHGSAPVVWQESDVKGRKPHPSHPPRSRDHRSKGPEERWHALDPKRKEELREKYKKLKDMSPEAREARLEQAKRLRRLMNELYEAMDAPLQARVDRLDPKVKRQYLARLAFDEARKRTREASMMQRESETSAHSSSGSDKEGANAGGGKRESGTGGKRPPHGPPGGRPESSEGKQHRKAFEEKVRQALKQYHAENGLPKGVSAEQWNEALAAGDREFGRLVYRMVSKDKTLRAALPKPPWSHRMRKMSPKRAVIHRAMRLTPEELLQTFEVPAKQRLERELSLRRARIMAAMKASDHFTEVERSEVGKLDSERFGKWMDENSSRRGRRSGKRGPRGGPGGRPGGEPRGEPRGEHRRGGPPHRKPGEEGRGPRDRRENGPRDENP